MEEKWKINGDTPADLGVEAMVLYFQNLDDDYAELRVPLDIAEATPSGLAPADPVVIAHAATVIFRGTVGNPILNATGLMHQRSIMVYGPWRLLSTTAYKASYTYTGSNPQTTTHATLSGAAAGIINSIFSQPALAGKITKGTIDLGDLIIPPTDIYDMSCADVIRQVTRFIPGALCAFDYSTNPPTCHIVKDNSAVLQTVQVDVDAGSTSNLRLIPRHDRILDGVVLTYELQDTRKTRTWYHKISQGITDTTAVTEDGLHYAGADTAGSSTGRILNTTIRLAGRRTVTKIDWQVYRDSVSLKSIFYETSAPANWMWLDHFMERNCPTHPVIDRAYSPTTISKTISGWPISALGGVSFPAAATEADKWYGLNRVWDPTLFVSYKYDRMALRTIPPEILYSSDYTAGIRVIEIEITWAWTHPTSGSGISVGRQYFLYGGSSGLSGGTISGSRTVDEGDYEAAPSGLAAEILAENSRLLWDGNLNLVQSNPAQFGGLKRLLSISPNSISSPIQRLSIDPLTMQTDISIGTPDHLGPQDRLLLRRANTPSA